MRALPCARPADRSFRLTMTNEALEAHVVRRADSTDLAAVVSFRRALSQNEWSSLRRLARFAQGLPPRIEAHDRRPGRLPAN